MEAEDRTQNLCDTCGACFADCDAVEIEFGEGFGNDNVIKCDAYIAI
jgi:hypothetical protein